jgi:predicted  nucleic acid-binding Zn-ribbon protein
MKLTCTRCGKSLSKKTARMIEGVVMCSSCMFAPVRKAKPSSEDQQS